MPELETQEERKPYDFTRLEGVPIGYTPLPTQVPGQPEGSLWKANFLQNTTIGSFIGSKASTTMSGEVDRDLNFIDNIPEDLVLEHADKYVGRKIEDFENITNQIRDEQARKALISAHPWKSFAIGIAESPVDPVSWLPMGALYRNIKHGTTLARTITGSGMAGLIGATAQEMVINRNQLTREAEESYANIAASGILAGALGGIGYGFTRGITPRAKALYESRERAHNEIVDTYTDKPKDLDQWGLLKGEDLINIRSPIRKFMNITPMNQLLNSPFETAKWFSNAMYQKNYRLQKHLELDTAGADVETLIRLDNGKYRRLSIDHQDHYFDMVGIAKGPLQATRAKLAGVDMTMDEFNLAVWRRLSNQVPHEREQVNAAASMWERELINPTRQKAIETGLLTEEQWPRNSPGYILQAYKKDLIIEQGGKSARGGNTFPQFLYDKFKGIQEEIKLFKESPEYQRINTALSNENASLAKLKEQKKLTPKTAKERIKKLNESIKKANDRINELKMEFKTKAPKRGLDSEGKLFSVVDDAGIWSNVEQTIDHILGDPNGALINPILEKIKGSHPSPLKQRKMTIEQEELAEWSVTDIPKLMNMYNRAMSPMLRLTELAQKMGAKDIQGFREMLSDRITAEFEAQAKGKTGKAAQQIRKQRDQAIKDMNVTFELLEGVYGDGPNVLNSSAQKYYQNFLKWNYIRLLGYMTISSIADAGAQVFVHGPYRFIHDGLVQSFSEARKISKRDLRGLGYAMETELGSRIHSWADHEGLSTNPGPFTKGLDVATQKFGNLSLMNQWNSWQQSIAGHIGINRTLEAIHKFVEGKPIAQKELERVVRNGLGREHWETVYNFTKNNKTDDGAYFADWTNWDIKTRGQREALEQFQASITKEIDSIIIVPGLGDKPLIAQTPLGKLLLQFKTFQMAATNRLLYSGIQRRDDINMYLGVISMLGMGAMSYVAASLFKGKEPDLSFSNLSREAVDKSGLLGIWSELGNIAAKQAGFGGTSRYQTRDWIGALSGPTAGAISEVLGIARKTKDAATDEAEFTSKDAQKIQRLMPFQNLFYLDRINKYLFKNTALAMGATDVDD